MPKVKISEWSSTPANNTDIDSINIAEGCAPSGINDAIRELMAQVKDLYAGTSGDLIAVAGGGTGVGTSTGSGNNVLSTSPTLVTPVLGTPSSGNLSSCTADGTDAVGFKNIPQNAQTGSYTLVLADSGKHIYHAVAAGAATYTIPANSSVAYPIGTAITFVNMSTTSISIAITTDTMYLAKDGTTGTRTLANYGSATALKLTSTTWLISGSALT
jgi:hypothetical protein